MQTPLEISYRNISKNEAIETLIRQKTQKLEKIHHNIISCHTVVERVHKNGNPFRVRVSIYIPHGHEIVATSEHSKPNSNLSSMIRHSFEDVTRQLKSVVELQRKEVKRHYLNKNIN